jgi:hypothetical protein
MYYEEKIIKGILCWRGTPKGAWIAVSQQEIATKYMAIKAELREYTRRASLSELDEMLNNLV